MFIKLYPHSVPAGLEHFTLGTLSFCARESAQFPKKTRATSAENPLAQSGGGRQRQADERGKKAGYRDAHRLVPVFRPKQARSSSLHPLKRKFALPFES
jgi:hypothetical protein